MRISVFVAFVFAVAFPPLQASAETIPLHCDYPELSDTDYSTYLTLDTTRGVVSVREGETYRDYSIEQDGDFIRWRTDGFDYELDRRAGTLTSIDTEPPRGGPLVLNCEVSGRRF